MQYQTLMAGLVSKSGTEIYCQETENTLVIGDSAHKMFSTGYRAWESTTVSIL